MDRMEMAKQFYTQAQKMTLAMASLVVAYGAMGYYVLQTGKERPPLLNAQIYPLAKYGALAVSILAVLAAGQLSRRRLSAFSATVPSTERPPQKLFAKTALMGMGAQLALLLGLVIIFLGRRAYDFIPFAIISFTGFALAFPKKREWASWLGAEF
jgi:hypothetical protein